MSIAKLKSHIKKNGKAKTAVALGLTTTTTIDNWLSRKAVPKNQLEGIKRLSRTTVEVAIDPAQTSVTKTTTPAV